MLNIAFGFTIGLTSCQLLFSKSMLSENLIFQSGLFNTGVYNIVYDFIVLACSRHLTMRHI